EADITAPYAGQATFQITLSNEAGPSPKASVSCFIGKGTPAIPIPYVTYADGVATLTWEPVTTAVDAGYINPDEITYSITRWPDNVKVAEHISETTFSDPIPEPEGLMSYYYTVVAEYGDKMSGYGTSVQFVVGSQGVPYINDFSAYNSLQFCKIIDGNDDNTTWIWGAGGATVVNYMGNVAMDDWLITPGINLEAGHSYYAEITLRSLQMQGEQANIEIKHGDAATPEGLTETIVPLTVISQLVSKPVTTIFRAEADGPHYIGVHAVAEQSNWAQVQKIVLKDAAMPDSVQNLTVTAQPFPAVAADLKFDAPEKTAAGDPLESISKIEIIRGGVVVKTFENVAPGETVEWEDVIGNSSWSSGNYMWTIVPYNEIGDGLAVTRIEHVGLAAPGMPESISAVEDGDTGIVTLSWSPVDYDVNGRPLDAQYIHYRILNGGDYIDNDPDVEGNTYTYQVAKDGEQKFAMMGVQLYNERASSVAFTPAMPVGKPYSLYNESFVGGVPAHDVATFDAENYGFWAAVADGYYEGYVSADNDGGFLCLTGESVGTASSICLGKFNLAGMERPAFSFSLMNVWDGNDEHFSQNYVDILVDAGEGYEKAATISCDIHDSCDAGRYAKQTVDLSRYADSGNIRIAIRGTIINYVILAIDKIKLAPALDHNLTLAALTAPSSARPGNELRINAFIENNGLKAAEDYTVTLYRDGVEVATLDGSALEPDATTSLLFTDKVSPLSASEISYTATVNYAADLDKSDNSSAEPSVVNVVLPKYPAPENLSAQPADDGTVSLTWDEPSATMESDPVTEGFESGNANAVDSYGDWTFIDKDGAMSSYDTKMAFMVYEPDPMILSFEPGYTPHSGNRYLSAWGNSDAPNDDWAISPPLSGSAQAVTFYARSLYDEDGGEAFRFLYSTGSLDPGDFVEVEAVSAVPAEWTLYTFNIPDGAKYFAINCVSQYQYTFMVDDVTYVPAGAGGSLSLAGYNVYRDGKAVNDAVVEDNAFIDSPVADGEYTYVVTALYDEGESTGSNAAVVTVVKSGLDSVVLSAASVITRKGEIVVTGAEGLEIAVVAIDGKTVASERGSAENVFPVTPGCYLVRIDRSAVKVIVR
ncbi:MAG: choice-of-anchor J domain-containing protein, partial [Duncaniella sp.]|nr:choice-of-anchor J domain-containing protein [Duncaniella sp.]